MDVNSELAPSVVAVMVVHQPGPEFDDVLASLAAQDYPNVKTLFLVVGEPGDLPTTIRERLPDAFVRGVAGNPGFGPAANEVLRLVEGENGFFMLIHDDVALEPAGVRLLVEELYRSNAGIVGPKLVDWDDQQVLQHVGLGVDRFGEVDPLVEPGEVDQEQHDAVRDVFALPSACLLVRADLFRALGGFDVATDFHGEDIDLCWRAHLGGARVVVVPTARARHREKLLERRPDVAHRLIAAQHRVRTVATLTGGLRLPGVLLQMLLLSLLEVIVGLFTGRLGEAVSSLRATVGLVPRVGGIIRRRREVSGLRQVPYREVAGLQIRGSARLASYLRTREQLHMAVDHSAVGNRRFSRNTAGQLAAWLAVLALAALGSRSVILNGVPRVGEFLRFPSSARTLLSDYWSGWWGHGLGQTTAVPTGIGVLGVVGVASLGNMGLLHTLAVIAWLPFGYYGAWRLMSIFPSTRARVAGMVTFAAVPLPYSALGAGRWSVVAVYGAVPWVLHLLRTVAAIEPALTARADDDVADGVAVRNRRNVFRRLAQLALLTAVVTAFAPTFPAIVVVMGVAVGLATVIARGSAITALKLAAGSIVAGGLAIVLNLPWFATLIGTDGWDNFVGPPVARSDDIDIIALLHFGVGPHTVGVLAVALWLPVLAAPLLARGWRLTWAARGGVLAVSGLLLAVLGERGSLPFRLPEVGLLLAPAACGIAVSAACAIAAFEQDVQGGSFGWRQPLGVLSGLALLVGAVPAVAATGNGRWDAPTNLLLQPEDQFGVNEATGDFRVLFVGDPRIMPVESWRIDPAGVSGVAFALVDDGPLTVAEHWAGVPSSAETDVRDVLQLLAANSTARIGRLLAPYAIRYVVIPVLDGIESTNDSPLPRPSGLIESLTGQLDLKRLITPPNYVAFENAAWVPTISTLSAPAAEASNEAGPEALATRDIAGSVPLLVGMAERGPAAGVAGQGVLHLSKPFDRRWTLVVDDAEIEGRVAFGATTAFDVPAAGQATLQYTTDGGRAVWVSVQLVLWLGVAVVASNIRWGWLRRRRVVPQTNDGPVLSLGGGLGASSETVAEPALDQGEAAPPITDDEPAGLT